MGRTPSLPRRKALVRAQERSQALKTYATISIMTIYLDNAATTHISQCALAAMNAIYNGASFANPASTHSAGDSALHALEDARRDVALCLKARASEVVFTSGGSEANNQALLTGAAVGAVAGKRHMVVSAIEHPSVSNMVAWLASPEGPFGGNFEVSYVQPGPDGIIEVADVREAMREDTCLVSVMHANNEVGSIQNVRDICRTVRKHGALFHTDAVQAAGHLPINFTEYEFDLLSVSAHKFHGPRGVGALLFSHTIKPTTYIKGGGQERGHRAGTVNVAGACGMAAALVDACAHLEERAAITKALRERFVAGITGIAGIEVLGPSSPAERLPSIVGFTVEGINREAALVLLDEEGLCMSAGSACAAGAVEESSTLRAMGIPAVQAQGYLRASIDALENTPEQIDEAVAIIARVVERLRAQGSAQ